jgi:hypothetical protein
MAGETELPQISPEALARAEAALAGLSQRYLDWATNDATRLRACIQDTLEGNIPLATGLPRLFTIAHDMKGQAATFGYPLVSELGNRLCRLIEANPPSDPSVLPQIARLAQAMTRVIAERLEGDGGEAGRRLLVESGSEPAHIP